MKQIYCSLFHDGLGIDDKLRSKNGTTVRYFLTDHLGSTEALTDSSGKIVSSTSYDSFGNATSNIATTYRYTGREYDPETGLYYYRNRCYDPEVGRFTSKDPIGFAGGDINLYGYVGNSPLNFTDPLGNYPCSSQNKRRAKFDEAVKAVKGILGKDNACSRFFLGQGLAALKGIVDTVNSQEEDKEKKTFKSLGDNKTGIEMRAPVIISYGSYGSPASMEDLKKNGPSPIALSPSKVSINTRGPFLSSWAKSTGGIRPNTLKSRAVQLLHEIGHLVAVDYSHYVRKFKVGDKMRSYNSWKLTHLLKFDGNNPSLSQRNTRLVRKFCDAQINALK